MILKFTKLRFIKKCFQNKFFFLNIHQVINYKLLEVNEYFVKKILYGVSEG